MELSDIQQFKIIADLFRVSYSYLRRAARVKPKLKEVSHESSLCRQNLDGLSPVPFKKNTLRSYESLITPFCRDHGKLELEELTVDLIQTFLESTEEWIYYYNHERGHSTLDDRTPDEVYYGLPHPFAEAA